MTSSQHDNESHSNLCELGKVLALYLRDHDDRYPDSISLLEREHVGFGLDVVWLGKHVKYLGGGKLSRPNPPDMIVAFDKSRLAKKQDTYVLFNA